MPKSKSKYTFSDKIFLPLTIVSAVCLLLGTLAGSIDPRSNFLFAYFALAYPYSLFVSILFLIWWVLRKKWVFSILVLFVIAIGYKTIHATFGFGGDEGGTEKAEGSIRMMTYNVHSFKLFGENNTIPVKEKMLQVVKDQNPDIICFQEFYTRRKGNFNTIDSLKRLLKTDYYYFRPAGNNDYEAFGLAIFSKYPIKEKGEILFEAFGDNMSIYTDLDVRGKTVRIFNVHFQSISFQPQDYQFIDQLVKKTRGKLYASRRILRMLKYAFVKRSEQVDIMKKEMAKCKTPYLIAGDFNDTPASYTVNQVTKDLNNAFIKKGSGFGKTYNGKFPNFQIDYIATSKDFDILNYQITKAKLSDHFPVRTDIKFTDKK
ncbi:endonuclease/exonuclease/phosphatase family protein [Pedobacter rhodius]|uniref:Endonuclease/exonuclease/phosphatase family protein n=1 Tax=Pedobacter rhodius TaxID=3004098 RepID=A0ABT4L2M3_9SPHI|nr:endonuclease/exonuclease/phosphatase family protein [Pedobacter sp. SJ11]MCZ4225443.1 endonuclease/exonuclease/phosphatase family protein [Pedobacter sp. SJ11]